MWKFAKMADSLAVISIGSWSYKCVYQLFLSSEMLCSGLCITFIAASVTKIIKYPVTCENNNYVAHKWEMWTPQMG